MEIVCLCFRGTAMSLPLQSLLATQLCLASLASHLLSLLLCSAPLEGLTNESLAHKPFVRGSFQKSSKITLSRRGKRGWIHACMNE